MITPLSLKSQFDNSEPYIKKIGELVNAELTQYCNNNKFVYIYRYKSLESLTEKIESGRYAKWEEIDDRFACSIVIPSLEKEPEVIQYIKQLYNIITLKNRGKSYKSPDVFRFEATRIICRLNKKSSTDSKICNYLFEIQIRSAFEQAWCMATHDIVYKNKETDWKKLRLAAHLKAAIEQLDLLILGFNDTSSRILEHEWFEITGRSEIINLFRRYEKKIPMEVLPMDWSRFGENAFQMVFSSENIYNHSITEKREFLTRILHHIDDEISNMTMDQIPRSITFLQILFGILSEKNLITPPLHNYFPLITKELKDLYPSVEKFSKCFILDTNTEFIVT